MFSFKYSPRPNTLAEKRLPDDVADAEKTRRIIALQQLQREIQSELNARMIGTTVPVLVDAASRRRDTELSGRTSGNVVVNLPGPASWIGRTIVVGVERAGPHSVWGRAVNGAPSPSAGSPGIECVAAEFDRGACGA
jgi:tRNA-2-methylthio-N6-dimethylallyladenosine synthase